MADVEPIVILNEGRERSVARRHPWVFNGAIGRIRGEAKAGDTVVLADAKGRFLARAAWNPDVSLVARVWSWDEDEAIDDAFIERRIHDAVARRAHMATSTDAVRLVFGENDLLPGVVADRYSPVVTVQLGTVGAERWRDTIVAVLAALPGVNAVVERSDDDARVRDGLAPTADRVVHGSVDDGSLTISEGAWRFGVNPVEGQKTGFYLDQRDSRALVSRLSAGRRVLDLFSYTGGFTVAARSGGATSVLTVDSSAPALLGAAANLERNGFTADPGRLVQADAFAYVRTLRGTGARFDLAIIDPPKLAPHKGRVPKASRAYKDVNLQAMHLLEPGGLLLTFSCSAAVDVDLFRKIVFGAATDAGRHVHVLARLGQPEDHPVLLSFPEGEYLTGLLCRVL